jgi:hypothetical protein
VTNCRAGLPAGAAAALVAPIVLVYDLRMDRCFVISPIGLEGSPIREHADFVFYFIIQPALKTCGIEAVRSDHMSTPGRITDQVLSEILNDRLCIAVLTGNNPNVFYELALALGAGRPTILLAKKGEEPPFDVRDLRVITYDLNPRDLLEGTYAKQVESHVKSLAANGWRSKALLDLQDTALARTYSLFVSFPTVNLNVADIEWDNDHCFVIGQGAAWQEKIALVPSQVGPVFEVKLGRDILEKVSDQAVELRLRDKKGNDWKVKSFYLFQNTRPAIPEAPQKILQDYGDEQ